MQLTSTNPAPRRSAASLAVALAISIAICFLAAAIGGLATAASIADWYPGLNKPSWNPPAWVFGPVWTTLYLMMAVAAWHVWRRAGLKKARLALGWFGFHLLLNVLWSVLFFGLQRPDLALLEIFFLWLSIAVAIVLFLRHSRLAAGLLVPYWVWVSFAAFLNFTIWSLNS